jgi:hypothetical protein
MARNRIADFYGEEWETYWRCQMVRPRAVYRSAIAELLEAQKNEPMPACLDFAAQMVEKEPEPQTFYEQAARMMNEAEPVTKLVVDDIIKRSLAAEQARTKQQKPE